LLVEIGRGTEAELGDDPLELACLLAELGYRFQDDEQRRRFASPRELVESIEWDQPAMFLCLAAAPE
jgi:hypothetical protein